MDKVLYIFQTKAYIKESGSKDKCMGKENSNGLMDRDMTDSTNMVKSVE